MPLIPLSPQTASVLEYKYYGTPPFSAASHHHLTYKASYDIMDPLSLTASIITVAGVSAKLMKILYQLASLKNAPPLAFALNNELSVLHLNVNAIKDLVIRQSELLSLHGGDTTLIPNAIASVDGCLKQAESFVKELDLLLSPLVFPLLRSAIIAPKKWLSWMKIAPKLERLKRDIYNVRINLNTTLGILGL